MKKSEIGKIGEDYVCSYLEKSGYTIVSRNYRIKGGEIDIIARYNGVIIFLEVKFLTTSVYGSPLEAVNWRKQSQIRKVAQFYLMRHGLSEWTPCRFDVIAFEGDEMTHIENAF